jgi:hypothetical protein
MRCAEASHLCADWNRYGIEVVSRPMKTHRRLWPFLAVLVLLMAACRTPPAGPGVSINAQAGPTCPVERVPPDPACRSRHVAGATILILDGSGNTVAKAVTNAQGDAFAPVPPGDYVVQPQPVDGLMGGAEQVPITVAGDAPAMVTVVYDTGIR